LAKQIASVVDTAARMPVPVEKTGVVCPKCGATEHGEIVIRDGKFGKFKSCSRFPECDFTERIVNLVEGVKCPLCHEGDVVKKPTRYGRDFYSCSQYPNCEWASWTKPAVGATLTKAEWAQMQAERAARKVARDAKFADAKKNKEAKSTKKLAQKRTKAAPRTPAKAEAKTAPKKAVKKTTK